MVADHLLGADLRRLGKGDLVVEPGRFHHPLSVVLDMPGSALHEKAHTVNEPYFYLDVLPQADDSRLFRNELRLRRHDRAARRTLGQFIPGLQPGPLILHPRQHQKIHKPLDERGFSGAHRPHDPYVNLSLCPGLYIFIHIVMFHDWPPSLILLSSYAAV